MLAAAIDRHQDKVHVERKISHMGTGKSQTKVAALFGYNVFHRDVQIEPHRVKDEDVNLKFCNESKEAIEKENYDGIGEAW